MGKKTYDFCGWATRNDIRCSDGRTIKQGAFKDNDGETVPLVWNHNHKDADNVLGHALLENRNEGVYAYCTFNNTDQGRNAKELVRNGDIRHLSIYANKLKQQGGDVIHGSIRELSLVLAGANPGAYIEDVMIHGENVEGEACIYNTSLVELPNEEEDLEHACNDEDDKKKKESEHAGEEDLKEKKEMPAEETKNEKTVKDVWDSMTEEQQTVCYALIGQALEDAKSGKNEEGDTDMKHNAFDNEFVNDENVLTHDEFTAIMADAKRNGSVKDAFLEHGIENVDVLFPEVQAVNKTPEMIQRDMTWVQKVMAAVHHTPFSRVKSTAANITADEARAKGYVKGNKKVEEVLTALKRITSPTTVYKLQKMDRDDVIDITDFDVIAWLKQEMRTMLDEEIARAILLGDGRPSSSNDKINEQNIRPIITDNSTYNVTKVLEQESTDDEYAFAKKFIKDVIKARKDYKGSGSPTLFTTEDLLTSMLLIEDKNGRVIYDTEEKLRTALRVKEIVTVEPMADTDIEKGGFHNAVLAVLVNLADYNVGADKGGTVNMFDDFDINYNKYEYLIETRCSGALVKPFSAVTFLKKGAAVSE